MGGLLLATLMAGAILFAMGVMRLGRFIEFVPYPVTTGFTAGIAVVIATLQVKDLLGLTVKEMPEHFVERVQALALALHTVRAARRRDRRADPRDPRPRPRLTRKVPAPLVALVVGAGAALAARFFDFDAATIATRFTYRVRGTVGHGIPPLPPLPVLPWSLPGPGGKPLVLSFSVFRELLPSAFAIAVLGAIESLLSAVVADGMTGLKHDPDAELMAQGTGDLVARSSAASPHRGHRAYRHERADGRPLPLRRGRPRPRRPARGAAPRALLGRRPWPRSPRSSSSWRGT